MANKPVIAIDVDDTQFKSFYELFNKYKGEIGDMPEAWKGANDVLNAGMAAVVEQTHNINKNIHAAITAQNQFAKATHVSNKGMKTMAKYAKETYEHIFNMGKFVLKAGAWGGGLLAAGTFGFDKLAGSVLKSAVSARSINTDTGRLRAFQTDYAQLAPANLPNAVYGAQRDMSKWGWLGMATGLSPMQASQADPVALSQALVRRAHDYYQQNKNNPAMLSEQSAQMQAFSAMGMDREAVTLAGNTPERKIIEAQRQMQADAQRLRYTSAAIDEMQKFWRALRIAGQNLETILGNRLSKLAGPIGKLITAVEDDAGKLLNGLLSKQNLDAAKNALDSFTKFLESGEAKADVKKLASDLKEFGSAVMGAVRFINGIVHPKPFGKKERVIDSVKTAFKEDQDWVSRHLIEPIAKSVQKGGIGLNFALPGPDVSFTGSKGRNIANDPQWLQKMATADAMLGMPRGFTRGRLIAESGGYTRAVSKAGAKGAFQFMDGTAREYGITDPYDPEQSLRGYIKYNQRAIAAARKLKPNANARELGDMLTSEYDMGIGGFAKFWKRAMKEGLTGSLAWEGRLPKETRTDIKNTNANYGDKQTKLLAQVARNTAKPVSVTVVTTTPVGARVAMQANAAR